MQHPIQIGSAGGEYMDTVLVLQWAVPLGAAVKAGEVVVTVETAKAATEVEAPADGQLVEICFGPGQEAPVGAVLGRLDDATGTAAAAATPAAPAPARTARTDGAARLEQLRAGRLVASPSARRAARERHVDLAQVTGTGPRGRIKRADVEAASRANAAAVAPAAAGSPLAAPRPAAPAAIGPEPLPIVLLHGFGADRTSWWPLARHLDARHRLVLPELPGHGQAAPRTVATVEDLDRQSQLEQSHHALRLEARAIAERLTAPRQVLIGNAAQAVHPVGAQGFNLGVRDVATLVELLAANGDPGGDALLARYAARRAPDRERTIGWSDALVRLFKRESRLAGVARGLAFAALDRAPPLKRELAFAMMGYRDVDQASAVADGR